MSIHHAPTTGWLGFQNWIRKKLGKKVLGGGHTGGEHNGLIAIIAGTKITILKNVCHGKLGQLFAITENTEFSFTTQYFTSTNITNLPAAESQAVILNNLLSRRRVFNFLHVLTPVWLQPALAYQAPASHC